MFTERLEPSWVYCYNIFNHYEIVIFDHPVPREPVPRYTYIFKEDPDDPEIITLPVAVVAWRGVVVLGTSVIKLFKVIEPDIDNEPDSCTAWFSVLTKEEVWAREAVTAKLVINEPVPLYNAFELDICIKFWYDEDICWVDKLITAIIVLFYI